MSPFWPVAFRSKSAILGCDYFTYLLLFGTSNSINAVDSYDDGYSVIPLVGNSESRMTARFCFIRNYNFSVT